MGIGGGGILLLYLAAFTGTDQLTAQGINLLFFLPTAAAALFSHVKNGFVKWRSAAISALFGIPGVFLGSWLAGMVNRELLRTFFAVFLLALGIKILMSKE